MGGPNKCYRTFFVHWFGQVHQSMTASKQNVVVFFQFEHAEFSGYVHFFLFRLQIPFLGAKNQNCQFILKFGTSTNSIMQNLMEMFNFSGSLELTFLGKFGPVNETCPFKLKIGTQTNSNMQNSMGMFTFLGFGLKYVFCGYLMQKFKFICSGKNLLPRLIRICRTQWWCSLHLFRLETPFLGKFGPKNENCQF